MRFSLHRRRPARPALLAPHRAARRDQRAGGLRFWPALLLVLVAGLLWAYMPAEALVAHVPAPQRPLAQDGLDWLSTSAGAVVDEQGRKVLLRGFNSDALLEPGVRHADLDERDAELIAAAGFNVVRLPIAWGLLEPQRGRIDTAELDRIDATVRLLNRHGLYVVLDMHVLDWTPRYSGSGAPDWALAPGVLDTGWAPWGLLQTHLNPAQIAATTYFWVSPDWQADFETTWRAVAQRFRDRSGVAAYDLYNEPHPLPIPPRIFERDYMWPFYARTIDDVGGVDPNHILMVEGIFFGNYGTAVRPLSAPNLIYSPHLYTGSLVPPSFDNGDPGPIRQRVAEQVDEAARVPAVLWSGELGIDRSMPNSAAWADAALDAFDDAGIGFAWWQWRESPQWGIRDKSGGFIDLAYLRHLARPYLLAAPAGVQAGRGDGVHGTLTVTVAAGHAPTVAVVAWSSLTLAAPVVEGSCAQASAWDRVGGRLTLALTPGQGCTVTLHEAG
jgi:endoglycosylceramidase